MTTVFSKTSRSVLSVFYLFILVMRVEEQRTRLLQESERPICNEDYQRLVSKSERERESPVVFQHGLRSRSSTVFLSLLAGSDLLGRGLQPSSHSCSIRVRWSGQRLSTAVDLVGLFLRSDLSDRYRSSITNRWIPLHLNDDEDVCGGLLGYFSHGLFVKNHRVLSRRYFTSREFYLRDLLSILPTDVFVRLSSVSIRFDSSLQSISSSSSSAGIPRIDRITYSISQRLSSLRADLFDVDVDPLVRIVFVDLNVESSSSSLRNSCAYVLICEYLGFGSDPWVLPASAKNESVAMLYTYCFYWSTLLLSTIGDVPLPVKRVEYLFVLFDFLIGECQSARSFSSLNLF